MNIIYKNPITNIFDTATFEESVYKALFSVVPPRMLDCAGLLLKPITLQVPYSLRDIIRSFNSYHCELIDGSKYKQTQELSFLKFENISIPVIFSSTCNEQIVIYFLEEIQIFIIKQSL